MSQKQAKKLPLHVHIATGGKPADYQGSQSITPETVNKLSKEKKVTVKK